jgi:thiol:disulfide interchange protein DsbD
MTSSVHIRIRQSCNCLIFLGLLLASLQGLGSPIWQQDNSQGFLPMDQAFAPGYEQDITGQRRLYWPIAKGHYLYRESIEVLDPDTGARITPPLPAATPHTDRFYGETWVYRHQLSIPIEHSGETLRVRYQGCADKGLCYPPEERVVPLAPPLTSPFAPPEVNTAPASSSRPSLWLFFLFGLGLTLTPCVLPMLPVLASVVASDHSRHVAFGRGLMYITGMATTFSLLGALVGWAGGRLHIQAWLQSPWLLVPVALVFVFMAARFFHLSWATRIHLPGAAGHFAPEHPFLMGALSSLVLSPCISAPAAALLLIIADQGDLAFGMSGLLLLALGMGLPMLVLTGTGISLLPRSGPWLLWSERVLGLLMLGVATWLLTRLFPPALESRILGLGVLVMAGMLMAATWQQVSGRVIAGLTGLGGLAVIGTSLVTGNPAGPPLEMVRVDTPEALLSAVMDTDKSLVLIDVYADWCESCRVMEEHIMPGEDVRPLLDRFHLVQMDVTRPTQPVRTFLMEYGLFGPPAFLVFDNEGNWLKQHSKMGELDANSFKKYLNNILSNQSQ